MPPGVVGKKLLEVHWRRGRGGDHALRGRTPTVPSPGVRTDGRRGLRGIGRVRSWLRTMSGSLGRRRARDVALLTHDLACVAFSCAPQLSALLSYLCLVASARWWRAIASRSKPLAPPECH